MGSLFALGLDGANLTGRKQKRKFGVLRFGYENFSAFAEQLERDGSFDINLGDNAQSIAIRNLLREFAISDEQIITINRDMLPSYSGPQCLLVMNAVFYHQSLPLPGEIQPVFIGFHAADQVIRDNIPLFKLHQPIGCRDTATTERMKGYGIDAFTTGCVTLTIPARAEEPKDGRLLIVYGSEFPSSVLQHIPRDLSDRCELIYHRFPVGEFPVSAKTSEAAEAYERSLLGRYSRTAKLVLTPLHHVAAPCMAMGIPVIICRSNRDDRFSFLEELTPIYTPETFASIDWRTPAADVSPIRDRIRRLLLKAMEASSQSG